MKYKLLAPCGMDCSACSFYLAYLNGIPKKRGSGRTISVHNKKCFSCEQINNWKD